MLRYGLKVCVIWPESFTACKVVAAVAVGLLLFIIARGFLILLGCVVSNFKCVHFIYIYIYIYIQISNSS